MFRTEITLTPSPSQLPLSARVLTVGSCFADTIGGRLAAHKVNTLVNPFGTVFNPLSACRLLRAAAGEEMDWQQHLVEARGRWQSYDLHSTVGADSPVTLLQQIRDVVAQTGRFLETADVVVLTLGTAFAYRLLETQELVSNCHKVPAEKFEKELLTPDEVINAVAETHAYLRLKNPKLRFILTVSPVRHLKDTLPLNAVSKSVLRVACHYLSELLPDVSYFPAYELLVDDLRDYRFYASDMLHPSEVAENYIWEKFTRTYFDANFGRFRKDWEAVRQALGHRPLYPAAPEHRAFLENTLERLHKLAAQTDVRQELREVQQQLAALPVPARPQPIAEPEPDDDEERIDIGESDETPAPALPAAAPERSRRDQNRRDPNRPARPVPQPDIHVTPVEITEVAPATVAEVVPVEATEVEVGSQLPELPKKKRRSRGGAKRTARKNAARAALEAAQQSVQSVQPVAVEAVETQAAAVDIPSVLAQPEPTPEVPLLTQELEVVHELPPVAEPAPRPAPVVAEVVPPAATEAPAPYTDWLVPMQSAEAAPKSAKRPSKGIVRTPPTKTSRSKEPIVKPPKAAAKPAAKAPAKTTKTVKSAEKVAPKAAAKPKAERAPRRKAASPPVQDEAAP
ncbi:GSCFA domain-containing protein, partial [Hymenobacter persicinus]